MSRPITPANKSRQAVCLPDTWSHTLTNGELQYQISVAVPTVPAPADGFPVMYLLDANASFATVMETHRRLSRRPDATRVHPAIIVGVGHATDALYDTPLRQRDFTNHSQGDAPQEHGGATRFLDFIQNQVKPLINKEFVVAPKRQILAGHSLAAFFTLWVLRQQPGAFQDYIALSPSIWWDKGLVSQIGEMADQLSTQRLFLAVGEWEEALAPWQLGQPGSDDILMRRQQRRMVSHVQELGAALQPSWGADRVQYSVLPEEDHASMFAPGISRAMRMMLS